ncbi:hypothetical protein B0H11DRAFT_2254332 [Mycena galericulata]|nr:hypothetical protein B0H11DRAFT_2254332 [Mycena galericulata]
MLQSRTFAEPHTFCAREFVPRVQPHSASFCRLGDELYSPPEDWESLRWSSWPRLRSETASKSLSIPGPRSWFALVQLAAAAFGDRQQNSLDSRSPFTVCAGPAGRGCVRRRSANLARSPVSVRGLRWSSWPRPRSETASKIRSIPGLRSRSALV